jgi:hypothetical protein
MAVFTRMAFCGAVTAACLTGILLPANRSVAHHSFAMFDRTVTIEKRVVVKEFQWTNPHVWIQVYIDNAEGVQEEWSIEGLGPNGLSRKGWRPSTFKPGEVIDLKFYPMTDGSTGGAFVGAKFANGDTLGRWQE